MQLGFSILFLTILGCNQTEGPDKKHDDLKTLSYKATFGKSLYEIGLSTYMKADHQCYKDRDGVIKAKEYFENAIKNGYTEKDVYGMLSFCFYYLDDKQNAEKIYSSGLERYNNDGQFYFHRGEIRKELKNYKGALSDYDNAILFDTLKLYLKDALYYRVAMSYMLGDFNSANIYMDKAQKITDYKLRTFADYTRMWQ